MVGRSKHDATWDIRSTHWSEIQAARTATPERRQAVLDNLVRRYWQPVYCYVRARGFQDSDARDITQDFFVDVILGRDLFPQADPERGRFRAFLLHCLKNYVRDRHRREHALRRSPDGLAVSLDSCVDRDSPRFTPTAPEILPADVFHQRWAAALLEQVLDRLHASCSQDGLDTHFDIFEQRVVRPALEHQPPTPLDELARRHGLTVKQAANRGETVRRRFRKLLLDEVRLTVMDEAAAEDELRSLTGHLRRCAG